MKKTSILLLFLVNICFIKSISSKILIFTYAFNRPDFIEIHHKTFKRFLSDEYEFIVFNDACDAHMRKLINNICAQLDIQCIPIPQEIHNMPYLDHYSSPWYPTNIQNSAVRNCNAVQYSLDTVGFNHDDILVLIDSDMFLIKEFSIREYLKHYELAGFHRPCYDVPDNFHNCLRDHPDLPIVENIWIALVFIDMKKISNKYALNFNRGALFANSKETFLDSGGYTYYYMQNLPDARIKCIDRTRIQPLFCNDCKHRESLTCHHNTKTLQKITQDARIIQFIQEMPLDPRKKAIERGMELLLGDTFAHYKGGTNWNNVPKDTMDQKTTILNNFINKIIND